MMCDPLDPLKCIICNVGFFMNNNLDCVVSTNYINHKIRVSNESIVNVQEISGLMAEVNVIFINQIMSMLLIIFIFNN